MNNSGYDALAKELREKPDSYFLENMSEGCKNRQANEVPYLIDVANICFDSQWHQGGLSLNSIAKFIDILAELHCRYIQSAKEEKRPPLDRQAMIDDAYWLLKKEQYISTTLLHCAISDLED
jgi:hypothetical protein